MRLGGWTLFPITSLKGNHCSIFLFVPYAFCQDLRGRVLLGGGLWLKG